MVFVGAAILPHGALPFDGDTQSASEACQERHKKLPPELARKFENLYRGICEAAERVAAMDPDLIILDTPHGIKLESSVGVYTNGTAKGTCIWNDQWDEFKAEVQLSQNHASMLLSRLRADGIPSEGIGTFGGTPTPMRWGEAVPIWFLEKYMKKEVPYVIMAQPLIPGPISMVTEERLRVGRSLETFVGGLTERVALVISGDLSHAYKSTYPDPIYQPAPGWTFHPDHSGACLMERAFIGWVRALDNYSELISSDTVLPSGGDDDNLLWSPDGALPWLEKAASLNPRAYACGMAGCIILHAFLGARVADGGSDGRGKGAEGKGKRPCDKIKTQVTACEAPTYYALMAAVFELI